MTWSLFRSRSLVNIVAHGRPERPGSGSDPATLHPLHRIRIMRRGCGTEIGNGASPSAERPECTGHPDGTPNGDTQMADDARKASRPRRRATAVSERDDLATIEALNVAFNKMTDQISRVIVGQDRVVEQVLVTMFCRGHALLIGVPGLAKTLLVRTLADVLRLSFSRIQFTPDLMPSDITGTDVLEEDRTTGKRVFRFVHGPLFANMILADEINRTPPKTQAALLEGMQEHNVTVGEETYALPEPFFVLATQNPIEQEGTYPLPEAQLDRFMFNIIVDYPTPEEELTIMKLISGTYEAELQPVLGGDEIIQLQQIVRRVPVADHVFEYARALVRATRPHTEEAPDFVDELVEWGAGPRASIYLVLAAKARAVLHGRYHATTEDIRELALTVLRHRVITTFNAEAAGLNSDDVVRRLLEEMPAGSDQIA